MHPKYFRIPKTESRSVVFQNEDEDYFYDTLHYHPEYQLTLIEEGEGTCFIDGNMYPFSKGDIFLLGENQPHVFRSNEVYYQKKGLRCKALTFFFSKTLLQQSIEGLPEGNVYLNDIETLKYGFYLRDENLKNKIRAVSFEQGYRRVLAFLELLLSLLEKEDKNFLSSEIKSALKASQHKRLNDVFDFLMNEYSKEVSLSEAAMVANMTTNAFCKYFKKHTRKTFLEFLNDIRITQACNQLKNPDKNIEAIAMDVGFTNVSNFNRQFKRRNQMSPSGYRKACLSN